MARRQPSLEHIQRRVRIARPKGIVYSSVEELVRDEVEEERGVPIYLRKRHRQKRLAITGEAGELGGELVESLSKEKEFDIVAVVKEFQHALKLFRKLSHALHLMHGIKEKGEDGDDDDGEEDGSAGAGAQKKRARGSDSAADGKPVRRIKIVAAGDADQAGLVKVFSRVSQVVHISVPSARESPDGSSGRSADSKGSDWVRAIAGACRKADVDRIILASSSPSPSAPAVTPNEAAVKSSGVPYVLARFPAVYGTSGFVPAGAQSGSPDGRMHLMHVDDFVRAFYKLVTTRKMRNMEINFVGEQLTRQQCLGAFARALSAQREEELAAAFKQQLLRDASMAPSAQASSIDASALSDSRFADALKARKLLGFVPKIRFERGVRDYLHSLSAKA